MSRNSVVKVPKASELVAANLRRRIVTGDLTAGQLLPSEMVLMQEFGVSRPTLREAFRILESEAIITVLRGARGGGRVMEPDGYVAARYMGIFLQYQGVLLSDVYRARTEMQVAAVGMIGAGRGKSVVRELRKLVERGDELVARKDDVAFTAYSFDFHMAVIEGAGSTTLSALGRMLYHIFDTHNKAFIDAHPEGVETAVSRTVQRAFGRLVDLLDQGMPAEAQRHWRKHLGAVERFMVEDPESTLVEILI